MAKDENCDGTGANTRCFLYIAYNSCRYLFLEVTAVPTFQAAKPGGVTPAAARFQPPNAPIESPSESSTAERLLPLPTFAQSEFIIDDAAGAQDVLRQRTGRRGSIPHLEGFEDLPVFPD
jgi:hypothetical protein